MVASKESKKSCEEFLTFKVTLLSTAGERGWQFTHWINDTFQGQVIMRPICSQGKNMLQILYTWRRDYAPIPESHFFSLEPERAAVGKRYIRHVCIHHFTFSWLFGAQQCEEIGYRDRATYWKHVNSIWLLLIGVSAVEWVMTQEPSCSPTDGQ